MLGKPGWLRVYTAVTNLCRGTWLGMSILGFAGLCGSPLPTRVFAIPKIWTWGFGVGSKLGYRSNQLLFVDVIGVRSIWIWSWSQLETNINEPYEGLAFCTFPIYFYLKYPFWRCISFLTIILKMYFRKSYFYPFTWNREIYLSVFNIPFNCIWN